MQPKNNTLRIAILAALSAASMGANAALIDGTGAALTAVKFASESPTTGTTLTGTFVAGSTSTSFNPTAGQNLQVTVDLTGGAKFAAAPALKCQNSAAGLSAAATLNLGGAGAAQAVFTLASAAWDAVTAAAITQCLVSASTITVTGAHVDVNMGLSYVYGNLASSQASGAIFTFVTGLSAGKVVGSDVVALVTGGFVGVSGGVASDLISAGVVSWMGNGTANSATVAAGTIELGTVLGATSGTITVAGNALLAAKATAGVFLVSAAGSCAASTAGGGTTLATAAGGTSPITFTGISADQLSAGVIVCIQANGTSAIQEGAITAQVGGTALTGYTLPAAAAQTLMTVSRNGSSATVLNMPRSLDTDAGFLRVYNTSTLAGGVTATVYDQAGTALATNCTLTASLGANSALVMTAAQVETACGFAAPATGRYRLDINGAMPTMSAQAFARSAGVLTNISAKAN